MTIIVAAELTASMLSTVHFGLTCVHFFLKTVLSRPDLLRCDWLMLVVNHKFHPEPIFVDIIKI